MFESTVFRQISNLLWEIFRESNIQNLDLIDAEWLYIRIELYCWGKAFAADTSDTYKINKLGYFPLHNSIFENKLSRLSNLLINKE